AAHQPHEQQGQPPRLAQHAHAFGGAEAERAVELVHGVAVGAQAGHEDADARVPVDVVGAEGDDHARASSARGPRPASARSGSGRWSGRWSGLGPGPEPERPYWITLIRSSASSASVRLVRSRSAITSSARHSSEPTSIDEAKT